MAFLQILTLSLLLSSTLCAKFRFYGADQPGGPGKWDSSFTFTSSEFTVCPQDLPSPFTLACIPEKAASYADFYIDGDFERTERVTPYTIAGDYAGVAQPWTPPSEVTVQCILSNGEEVESTITFACDGSAAPPPPPTEPPTTKSPPDFDLSSGSAGSGIVSSKDCVKIPALSYESADIGPDAWVKRGQALVYKPNDKRTSIIPAGRVTATYKFKAPANGRFGFILDMETSGGVDHNDVWVLFQPGGFILTRGSSKRTSSGWTKAYHNRNGRQKQIFSVDFNPHSFATKNILKSGQEYTVKVGGRSTKTGFYSIIMFPCSGSQCDGTSSGNSYWKASREKCGDL